MLDVFFTVDVEIWCDGWEDIDRKFPDAFRRYVYGPTPQGDFGLPYLARELREHGLTGVFFVEPLFAARFGTDRLQEIVSLVEADGHEVQLHLHTEWADEARVPLLGRAGLKRQHLRDFSLEEQTALIAAGARLVNAAARSPVCAFRAGNFAFNRDSLHAARVNGIRIDCSYNASRFGPESGVSPGEPLLDVTECDGVVEYPMTVFRDGTGSLRHTQLTACSFPEMESLLWQALEVGRRSFVILSHNFELMDRQRRAPDPYVIERFHQLCEFLARHQDAFRVRGFHGLEHRPVTAQPPLLSSSIWETGQRLLEQGSRRGYW